MERVKLFLLLLLFMFIGCNGGGDQPATPAECAQGIRILTIEDLDAQTETQVKSESQSLIRYEWKENSGVNDIAYLELIDARGYLYPNPIIREKQITISSNVCSQDTFNWNGTRKNGMMRTITALPGDYYMRVRFGTFATPSWEKKFKVVVNDWDKDGDGISDAVENENAPSTTSITYGSSTYYYDAADASKPPIISSPALTGWEYNVETHDYSLAKGSPSNGSLTNGLRIADAGTGYYDKNFGVTPITNPERNYFDDEHNWGTFELINLVEKVAMQWNKSHPSGPRTGIGDMSLEIGGFTLDHSNHQNGLEVDIRYVRNNGTEGELDLINNLNDYSQTDTQNLIDLFQSESIVFRIIVDPNAQISGTKIQVDNVKREHRNHFHVWINDPDGVN